LSTVQITTHFLFKIHFNTIFLPTTRSLQVATCGPPVKTPAIPKFSH